MCEERRESIGEKDTIRRNTVCTYAVQLSAEAASAHLTLLFAVTWGCAPVVPGCLATSNVLGADDADMVVVVQHAHSMSVLRHIQF